MGAGIIPAAGRGAGLPDGGKAVPVCDVLEQLQE